jgi:hypothetical protein
MFTYTVRKEAKMNVEIFKAGKNWIAVESHNGMQMVVCRAKTKKALIAELAKI